MRALIFVFFTLILARAEAQTSALATEVPSHFNSTQLNLGAQGVAQSCLTMTNLSDSLPCQPALISNLKEGSFMAQGTFGNSYEALQNANRLLNKNVDTPFVQSLFSQNQVMEMQLNTELTFMAPGFAAQFIPYRVNYFSVVRNKSYPVVALHALQSRIWNLQTGTRVNRQLQVGAQLSFHERKFIHAQFDAYDVAAEDGHKQLQPKTQKAIFVEPGAVYTFSNRWRPRVSLLAKNLGYISNKYEELDDHTHVEAGIGVTPPLKWGKLEVSAEYHPKKAHKNALESATGGISYKLGHMTTMLGASAEGLFSGGILFGLQGVRAGIVYTSNRVPFADGEEYVQSIYSQFGFQI